MDRIAARLADVDGLYYPTAFLRSSPTSSPPSPPIRKSALLALLSRDALLFLERYGAALHADELASFDALRDDYEVGWHIRRLRASGESPAPARVRNRRRAYLHRLVHEGDNFSEEAMREREPYLHHEYLGRLQDPVGRAMGWPMERWPEMLMRWAEEAVVVEKIRGEQIRRGVDPIPSIPLPTFFSSNTIPQLCLVRRVTLKVSQSLSLSLSLCAGTVDVRVHWNVDGTVGRWISAHRPQPQPHQDHRRCHH